MARKPKISSVADRVRGAIAMVLCVSSFTFANLIGEQQLQLSGIIAGLMFLFTIFYWMKDCEVTGT